MCARAVLPPRRLEAFALAFAVTAGCVPAQAEAEILTAALPPGDTMTMVEKADLRRYEAGKFIGLAYREVRAVVSMEKSAETGITRCAGTFYVLEETKHDAAHVARRIDETVPVSYAVRGDGTWETGEGLAYPSLRGFPLLPDRDLVAGEKWQAYGTRVLDPLRDGRFTRVKFYCDYRYDGERTVDGRRTKTVTAKYAVRYRKGQDAAGDDRLQSVSGTHDVTVSLDPATGSPFFLRDAMEESCSYADGKTVVFKGFILTWLNAAVPLDREGTARKIAEELSKQGTGDVEVTVKKEGVSLSINRIHFIADQAVVLPEEKPRLEAVAEALRSIPGRSFRVIGHTADYGTAESQLSLSVLRAKAVVEFLASRGIDAGRFLYEGRGGTEPVAPNDTEENMARNRRVEILILED
jgi:OmpA-OmpF porin, OOP family